MGSPESHHPHCCTFVFEKSGTEFHSRAMDHHVVLGGVFRTVWVSSRPRSQGGRPRQRQTVRGKNGTVFLDRATSACLEPALQERGLEKSADDSVVGVVRMRPMCVYNHIMTLSALERSFAELIGEHFGKFGLPAYVFEIAESAQLTHPAPWSLVDARARCGAVWFQLLPGGDFQRLQHLVDPAHFDIGADEDAIVGKGAAFAFACTHLLFLFQRRGGRSPVGRWGWGCGRPWQEEAPGEGDRRVTGS